MLLVDSFPWMRFLLARFRRYVREGFALQRFFHGEIQRHQKAQRAEQGTPDNFIDFYLREMQDSGTPGYLRSARFCPVVTCLPLDLRTVINNH